jgi:uncharacterized membrane protein YhaH (DUF805 family)
MRSPYHPLNGLIAGLAGGVFALLVGGRTGDNLAEAVVMFAVLVPALGMMVQRMRDFGPGKE